MAKNSSRRVVNYKKPRNINIGIIIFGITFIYIIINLVLFFSRDEVTIYEVKEGKSEITNEFTGLILREESISTASQSGYINFYARESSHVAIGTNLYSISQDNSVSLLEEASDTNTTLNEDSINKIKDEIYNFTSNFSTDDYLAVYDLKSNIEATVIENYNLVHANSSTNPSVSVVKSDKTGTILYYTDNYESITADSVSMDLFDQSNYKKNTIKSKEMIENGSPIYKTVTSENWNILVPLTQEEVQAYKDETSLEISFLKSGLTLNGDFRIINDSNGNPYGEFHFNKYAILFASERFVDIKIVNKEVFGLKIPKSSVVEKDFYIIPLEFLTQGGDNNDYGFSREVYSDNGQDSIEFITPKIYYKDESYCYVDKSSFKEGDVIVKNDSSSRYQIGETAPLKGAYNINNGYTEFKQIVVKSETNEYYIIEKNTSYGLTNYDHIVLDASLVKENQVVYQ